MPDATRQNEQPTHVIADPGDTRSICGVKNPLPVVAAKHVQAHIDGRARVGKPFPICDECRITPAGARPGR